MNFETLDKRLSKIIDDEEVKKKVKEGEHGKLIYELFKQLKENDPLKKFREIVGMDVEFKIKCGVVDIAVKFISSHGKIFEFIEVQRNGDFESKSNRYYDKGCSLFSFAVPIDRRISDNLVELLDTKYDILYFINGNQIRCLFPPDSRFLEYP